MPFALESTKFIELRVLEECMQLKRYDEDFIGESVDSWADIIGFDTSEDWMKIILPQLKEEIHRNLKEGRYFYAAL